MGRAERGFTLLETLVAVAISVVIGYLLILAASSVLHWSAIQAQRDAEHAAIGELVDRWTAEEDSAWAIFTPPADVFGTANADGHEIDFFTRDGKNQSYFWAYDYDAQTHTLTRYIYNAPGATPVKDIAYTGITKFLAHTYPVTALQDASTPIHSALYDNAALHSGIVHFYPSKPWIAGGNNITYLRVEGTTMVREMQLVTQTAPTGFTVVLRYTPAPAATPTPGALQAWPQFVELPIGGQALQTAYVQPRHDFGFYLNQFFGGAVADALSPCGVNQGRAFQDAFVTPLANASAPAGAMPSGVTAYTDGSGCITINDGNGSNVELYEPGNTSALSNYSLTCGSNVIIASASPASYSAAHVGLRMQGGPNPQAACSSSWKDAYNTTASIKFQVSGCSGSDPTYTAVGIGVQCLISYSFLDDGGAGCDPSTGATSSGYTGNGITKFSGPGTWDGTTFTRTGTGTATIIVQSQYQRATATLGRSGGYRCSISNSYVTTDTITIND